MMAMSREARYRDARVLEIGRAQRAGVVGIGPVLRSSGNGTDRVVRELFQF